MMRVARKLLATCTVYRTSRPRQMAVDRGRSCLSSANIPASTSGSRAFVQTLLGFVLLAFATAASGPASAQYRGAPGTTGGKAPSAFGEQPGGIFGKPQALDKTLPLYLQGD